ncbi:pyrroloquinoline quinone biosynthesis protein PqqE [Azospirillum sp. TSO35-2]|uniref:pyrroloquinoline quinone biosynthesis protein PqqE n=1 Tax=Azospirillum sp. TSO35-2 TaxID=716796 RepID=UPI000D6138FE|nr:pyrroloquinoline quinone biosynthesis protein PqqE [Azospirillum sp. TSO35-2]PWC37859.1 pyrroloquinoline quinone biosynthesis protein PqqE [Azospirillum sp. TSO35-2]
MTTPVALPDPPPDPPYAVLAELTHRCPLACPYCSNPLALEPKTDELDTATWMRVLDEVAEAGALHVHFSGGEPCARPDLEALVAHAARAGLYTNLITSAVTLDRERLDRLKAAGLQHVQISFQDTRADGNDRVAGFQRAFERKRRAAGMVVDAGLALTVNAIVHRHNIDHVDEFFDLALDLRAGRIEVANVQYYGWALLNRAALMPTHDQLVAMDAVIRARLPALKGRLVVDYVVPDYYARRPKACMGGWGRRFLNVTPSGKVLPCHAAETIPGLVFETVHDRSIADIWRDSPAFERFRGTGWMPSPCRECDRREIDWGGCRCQALAISGNAAATDPVCELAEDHAAVAAIAERDAAATGQSFIHRPHAAVRNTEPAA